MVTPRTSLPRVAVSTLFAAMLVASARQVAAQTLRTCSGNQPTWSSFTGSTFDTQHVQGYFTVVSLPGSYTLTTYQVAGSGGGGTVISAMSLVTRGERIQVTRGGSLTVNGVSRTGSFSTTGGVVVTALGGTPPSYAFTHSTGVSVTANAYGTYLNLIVNDRAAPAAHQASVCATNDRNPVLAARYDRLIADVRVSTTAGPAVEAGRAMTFDVAVENVGEMLHSVNVQAPPSWGTATGWTCVPTAGASCGEASGTGNLAALATLPKGGRVTYAVSVNAPGTLEAGSVTATATPPAWTTAATTSVNQATLAYLPRYRDADGDGFGVAPLAFTSVTEGWVETPGDCDDADPAVVPGTPACCRVDLDCVDDGDLCTASKCTPETGACTHEPVPSCCNADADCDDDDPCTADACRARDGGGGTCAHAPVSCEGDGGVASGVGQDGGAEPESAGPSESDGCGCRQGGAPRATVTGLIVAGAALLALGRRVRRRGARTPG